MEPPTVASNDEDAQSASSDQSAEPSPQPSPNETEDTEVAVWVSAALERRRRGALGAYQKPALHAVALDAVAGSPLVEEPVISPTV